MRRCPWARWEESAAASSASEEDDGKNQSVCTLQISIQHMLLYVSTRIDSLISFSSLCPVKMTFRSSGYILGKTLQLLTQFIQNRKKGFVVERKSPTFGVFGLSLQFLIYILSAVNFRQMDVCTRE